MNLLKRMLGIGLSFLLILNVGTAGAQSTRNLKERRIFLWDVTISMVGATNTSPDRVAATPRVNPKFDYAGFMYDSNRDIFDHTRQELLNMIDDIKSEECEIVVVPYTKDIQEPFWVKSATAADKERIKKMVMGWDNLKPGGTYTGTCLQKVITQYFSADRANRVVLLTDGRPDDGEILYRILREWDHTNPETRYHNSRLVYVMLTEQAVDQNAKEIIEEGDGDSTTLIEPGESLSERLVFNLSDNLLSLYLSDYSDDGFVAAGGNFEIGCNHIMGPDSRLGEVICKFSCEDNPLISIAPTAVKLDENGKFIVPFTFKGKDREYYFNELHATGLVGNVLLSCKLDSSCKDIAIEGSNEVLVEVVVKPEPRVVISLSKK